MRLTLLAIAVCVIAFVQTPKTYTKNGLSFDYPADWNLQEGVNDDAQQLTLAKANSDVQISASVGGETGASKIYWAVVGQHVVVLTLFGPDKQLNQNAAAWDLVRNSLKVVDAKAAPAPKASP